MSHVVSITTKLRDPVAIAAACRRLGLAAPEQGIFKLFAGQEAHGWAVRLPGWRYPAVIDATSGAALRQLRRPLGRPPPIRPVSASLRRRKNQARSAWARTLRQRTLIGRRQRAAEHPDGRLSAARSPSSFHVSPAKQPLKKSRGSNTASSNGRTIAMPPILEITVSPQGETTIRTQGYEGASCQEASKFLERALGVVTTDARTSEYFATAPSQQQQQQQSSS